MAKQTLQVLKWLPLAALGMVLPTAYLWLFLWCLNFKVSFWELYGMLYGGTVVSSLLIPLRRTARLRNSRLQDFTFSQPQLSQLS